MRTELVISELKYLYNIKAGAAANGRDTDYKTDNRIEKLQKHLDDQGSTSEMSELIDAIQKVDCACSVAERDSGHKIGCFMPEVQPVIDKYKITIKRGSSLSDEIPF